ncbi:MAG: substrate-binding domain-containing protein [Lacunisphaera sp.]|nr:substrate-binding domain-containing protein [Lacunisphaera sp.]
MNSPSVQTRLREIFGENRIVVLLLLIFGLMAVIAPNFLTTQNLTTIMKGMSLNLLPVAGLTFVMICGHIDLSVGTSLTLGGMLTIGLQPVLGWPGAMAVALLTGLALGLVNGLLVARLRIDSFIVTLGAMIVTQGLVYLYGRGGVLTGRDFRFGTWLEQPLLPLLTPRVILSVAFGLMLAFLLARTAVGRGFFLVGGNAAAARNAGLPVSRYIVGAFMLSGGLTALGGALFSASINSATPTMGNNSLMEVITAVIIGGTAMTGGRGNIARNLIALLGLSMLYNGLELMGAGWEARKMSAGLVLGAVVLYEAAGERRLRLMRGVRHELLAELAQAEEDESLPEAADEPRRECIVNLTVAAEGGASDPPDDPPTPDTRIMKQNESNPVVIVCITAIACVAITGIVAMYLLHLRQPAPMPIGGTTLVGGAGSSAITSAPAEVDVSTLKSADGQQLLPPPGPAKTIPARPANPETLPETDAGHWYDMEYAGWGVEKVNLPKSPGDGPRGKRVVYLKAVDHPYQTAMVTGMQKVADAYGVKLTFKTANSDINIQSQQVDQVINDRPDLVIISAVDAQACVPLFRRLNEAGIPVIAINLLPVQEAHRFLLAWTGPDDWGQMRKLAREFANLMHNEGGYVMVQHRPGSSPFFARTWAAVTELKVIAPKMKMLVAQPTDLESEKTKEVVSGWLTRFGGELKGVFSADDSGAQVGINEAIKNANREDVIRVAAGNSKVGMDFVQQGTLHAITFQSPEADGAIPMKLAADWFAGKKIQPIQYLPQAIITKGNVKEYLPAQW